MNGPRGLMPAVLAAALALGCEAQDVSIQVSGTLYSCGDPDSCDPVSDAPIDLVDLTPEVRSETVTDEDGDFVLEDVPGNSVVFTVAERVPDYLPTVFVGQTGSVDGEVEDGLLYAVSDDEAQSLIDDFSEAHPDGDTVHTLDLDQSGNGGIARGRFLAPVEGVSSDEWPGRDSLSCYFQDEQGTTYPCVYYDADGEPDWSLETTSLDGGWAAFGLPAGLLTGVVLDGPEEEGEQDYVLFYAYAVEDGVLIYDVFPSPF